MLAAAASVAAHVAVGLRLDRLVATAGEARLAAAAYAVRRPELGAVPLPLADAFAARQLAGLAMLLPLRGVSVLDAARITALVLGLGSVLLLWPVLRQLGAGPVWTAVALALVGVTPPVVVLHAGVTAAAPAACWLAAAAALVVRTRGRPVLAVVAAVLAVLTAPLVAAGLLALAAHVVAVRFVGRRLAPAPRRALVAGLALAAVGVAAAAAGNGPLAGVGGPVVGPVTVAVVAAAGLAVGAVVAARHPVLRPLLGPAALLLAVAVVPGAGRAAALLLVLPLLAVALAVVAEAGTAPLPRPVRVAVAAVPAAALAVALVAGPVVAAGARPPSPTGLAAWAATELRPDAVLRADPLDRAELLADGVAAGRLRDLDGPALPGELLVLTRRPTTGAAAAAGPPCAAVTTLASMTHGTGGAPTTVCPADPVAPATAAAEQAGRARFGSALARNPALTLEPAAAAALEAGLVDPRVVLVLADLASPRRLAIADFPVAPYEPPDALRRRVLLTAVDGMPASGDPQPLVRTWLTRQLPPFVPSAIEATGPALLIVYPAPAPTGLLAAG